MPRIHTAKQLAIHLGGDDVSRMLARQNRAGHAAHERPVPGGVIGCLGPDSLPPTGSLLFFTGAPINGPDPQDLTGAEAAVRLLPSFDGAFVGVFWDAERRVLVVATDCLGMQPLYLRRTDGELVLVSETKALAGEPDLAAWGAFIAIGHPIGDRSLMQGLKRAPPASILVYDCRRRSLSITRYWNWPAPSAAWRGYDFLGALEAEIRAYAGYGRPGTLLLSGGFDSRLLLFLLKRARLPVAALIVAHDDEHNDADGRLAERIARVAALDYHKTRPRSDFFSSAAYLDYLAASDVGYPSLGLFIAKVAAQITADAVWDGLAPGFVFMPLHQPKGGFDAYLQNEIRGWDSTVWHAARTLFKPEVATAMYDGFKQDLQTALAGLPRDGRGLTRFVIENRSRNRAAMNPLKVYANRTAAFTPGLSKDFLAHAVNIPFHEKYRGRFYRTLLARLEARALKVPFLSGGELLPGARAGPAYYRERLRLEISGYRSRHPRLFALSPRKRAAAPRFAFLDDRLIAPDRWLAPDLAHKLRARPEANAPAWRLLFHWQAWQWLHDGRLAAMLVNTAGAGR